MTDDLPMRPIDDSEWPAFWATIARTFHGDVHDDESAFDRSVFEPERSLAIFDGDTPVATTGIYTRDLSVPGGAVIPAAHVTLVSVLPTHRRRGLLTRMMRRQLADVRAAGEPVAVLWASEEPIYGRYGYGTGSYYISIDADTREVRLPDTPATPGTLRLVEPTDVVDQLAATYERATTRTPGFSSRPGPWWKHRLTDLERHRGGASALRCVVHETASGITGYALWRAKEEWDATGPISQVKVEELVTDDVATRASLWRFLFDLDLIRRLSAQLVATDDPLFHLVDAPRRLRRRITSGLHVRIVDLPAALAARRYPVPVDLVLEVTDELLPDNTGRWRLVGNREKATCEPTTDSPDLRLGIRELGAIYLGGTPVGSLAATGLITGSPDAVAAAHAGFSWPVAPFSPAVF